MSQDHVNDAEVKALRHLIDEARAAAPPERDWEAAEAKLLSRIELERKAQPKRAPRTWSTVLSFAVAAAAAAMLVAQLGHTPEASHASLPETGPVDLHAIPAEQLPDELPTYMVAAMKPHSVVEAGDEPVRFALPGVATWVLEPNSRVVVDSVAVPHVLTLERGAVHAEVVERSARDELVETFAVVAGTTRVAVHGTVFSVTRTGDKITVEVSRGAVTVGPSSHRGITTGRLLVSPARAAFWIYGSELAEVLPGEPESAVAMAPAQRPTRAMEPEQASPAAPAQQPHPRAQGPGVEVAPQSDAADAVAMPLLNAGQARALVMGCLQSNIAGGDDRVTTISSRVTALVDSTGKIETVRYTPPVRPDLQERCSATLFHRRTATGASLSFQVDVKR